MAKLKHPISCKALTRPPKDQKSPPFTGGFVPNKPTQNKVCSFDLTKVDALFDEICVVFRDVIQEGITAGMLKLAEKPPSVTTDPFPSPQINIVNLNWLEQRKSMPTTEASSSKGRIFSRETAHRPKATISAGVVLCSKCKCKAELEVVLDRQNHPTPSVFDRIGTSHRDKVRQKDYPRPAQRSRRLTEQPKREISIKMPGDEKPLAAIIEGRWYAVGKTGRPTMELTRTQKRMVQRQYCTFLNNKSIAQILPETNSARKGKEPERPPQAEQAIFHSQKMLKAKSPDKPYQLDYEPSADDQNALLGVEGQEDWTEEFGEEQMEYDGELDAETEAFGAELEDLLQNVFSQESFECRLAEAEEAPEQQAGSPRTCGAADKSATEQLCFSKPTKEMANHLRPLFITANFGGVPIPKVMIDGGAAINLLPYRMLSKMGRTEKDLIPTRLTVTNFAGGITKTHGILDVDVIVGSKKLKIAFFVVDTTSTTYNALLGRDWIHQSLCVPSTLHQQLALWNEEGCIEIIEADPRPFLPSAMCFEARYYHDDLGLNRELVEHRLPIKEGYLPVKQARRRMSMDTELKVKEKIERLLKAGFIRPAIYADWLANIVPVLKRKTGAVRICVDYRNLNEASPKDEYPMPMADMLVDGAAHNQMLSFMDGNAGYNQIMMAEEDIHKTAFMCPGHIGKIQPFSSLLRLKQEQTFKWEEQHQQAFEEIKHYLSNPPVLSPPKRGRPLKLYVSASEVSIGSLLVQDNKEGKEQSVYYLNRTLTEVERKYSAIERLCLALYFTAVKLRHYMLPYTIYIIAKTDLIKYMLTRPMLRGRIGK
ncbi:unnamed protein product [Prunus brigantina]